MKVQKNLYRAASIMMIFINSMAYAGVKHFNDLASAEEKKSGDIIPYLEIKKGTTIADLGAGGGYFSLRLAQSVGAIGKVYAVDINPESIEYIRRTAKEQGLNNIVTVLGTPEDSGLKSRSIDLVFVRNAYHDIRNRVQYFSRLRTVLKPGARIAIIDYDPRKLGVIRKLFGHALDEKVIIDEMKQAGYVVKKSYSMLREQSFNIFIVKPEK